MPPSQSAPRPAEGFWRCSRCGTPNPWALYLTACVGCGAPRPARGQAASAASRAETGPPPPASKGRPVAIASWAYAGIVLVVLIAMRALGDRWWPATLLLFSPRFVWLLPLVPLAIAAWRGRRRRLWLLHAATAGVVLGPLMGLSLATGRLSASEHPGVRLRILTLNRSLDRFDPVRLSAVLDRERVDVVCFQEIPVDRPLHDDFLAWSWHRDYTGMIASRFPIVREAMPSDDTLFPEYTFWAGKHARAEIELPNGQRCWVIAAHMPTIRYGVDFLLAGEASTAVRYADWRLYQVGLFAQELASVGDRPALVAGDFNMTRDSPMMDLFRRGFRIGYEAVGLGYGYTFPGALPFAAIDHILASPEWTFTRCWVGPDVGSDHRPLLAEVVLPPPQAAASRPDLGGSGRTLRGPAGTVVATAYPGR